MSRAGAKETSKEPAGYALYLVRHAVAAARGDKWPDDTKRPLTHKGMAKMRLAVRGLRELGVELDLVLTSPLVRAHQILIDGLESSPDLEITDALEPDRPPTDVAAALGGHPRFRAIALVGHEPGLGELAAWLIGTKEPLVFRKGGVCRIDVPALPPGRNGRLLWFATPKMLRALG